MNCEDDQIHWSPTATSEESRREQLRRWSQLTLEEIVEAQEEMAELAEEFVIEPPAKDSHGAQQK